MIPEKVAKRAATKFIEDERGCYISVYSVGSHGYAQIGWWVKADGKSRMTTAHRAAYQHHHSSPIPDGMTVDHTCRVRACVRPDHLRLLSNRDNARRNAPGRDFPLDQFCANGHPETEAVSARSRSRTGKVREFVRCGACVREAHERYRDKRRAA